MGLSLGSFGLGTRALPMQYTAALSSCIVHRDKLRAQAQNEQGLRSKLGCFLLCAAFARKYSSKLISELSSFSSLSAENHPPNAPTLSHSTVSQLRACVHACCIPACLLLLVRTGSCTRRDMMEWSRDIALLKVAALLMLSSIILLVAPPFCFGCCCPEYSYDVYWLVLHDPLRRFTRSRVQPHVQSKSPP